MIQAVMRRLLLFSSAVIVSVVASQSFAQTFESDGRYTYVQSSWKEWAQSERQAVIKETVEILGNKLQDINEKYAKDSRSFETVENVIEVGQEKLPQVYETLQKFVQENKEGGVRIRGKNLLLAVAPTAPIFVFGGKLSGNLKFGGSGSIVIGVVVLVRKVHKIDNFTGELVDEYFTLDFGINAMPAIGVGVGVGGNPGAVRVGAGLIWGHLDDANDFTGLGVGLSGNVTVLGMGMNIKGGFMVRTEKVVIPKGVNPYLIAAGEWSLAGGPVSNEASAHVSVTPVLTLPKALRQMFNAELGQIVTRLTGN